MDIKKTAIQAARKAGDVLLEMSKKEIKYTMKNKYDVLAEADLKAEEIIISQIKKDFPDHSIFSEEQGKDIKESEYCWIVDPLDGSINFTKGIEEYCVAIAVERNKELILAIIYKPYSDQLYFAEKGKGSFLNDKKLSVSDETELMNMILATEFTSNIEIRKQNVQLLSQISDKVRQIRLFGSGSLHLARMAAGQIDIYCRKGKAHYWDWAPGILLVKEAGGMVTDFQGNEISCTSQSCLATNGKRHQEILKIICR